MRSADLRDGMNLKISTRKGTRDWSFRATTSSSVSDSPGRTTENAGKMSYMATLESYPAGVGVSVGGEVGVAIGTLVGVAGGLVGTVVGLSRAIEGGVGEAVRFSAI